MFLCVCIFLFRYLPVYILLIYLTFFLIVKQLLFIYKGCKPYICPILRILIILQILSFLSLFILYAVDFLILILSSQNCSLQCQSKMPHLKTFFPSPRL